MILAALALLPFAAIQDDGPRNGLAGYWKLDETAGYYAADSSGAGQSLMIIQNQSAMNPPMLSHLDLGSTDVPLTAFADPGSFSFSGGDDYISTFPDFLSAVTDTFTIAFWAKPTGTWAPNAENATSPIDINQQRLACSVPSGSNVPSAGVSVGTNGVCVVERNYSTFTTPLVCQTAVTGWVHVAVVYVDRRPALYLNGELARTGVQSQNGHVKVGGAFGSGATGYFYTGGWYQGQLDDIRIYSRALADGEIALLGRRPPGAPTSLGQYAAGATLASGTVASTNEVLFMGTLHGGSGQMMHLEVEIKESGQSFPGGRVVLGAPAGDGEVAAASAANLAFGASYHWRARSVREQDGAVSAWVLFGGGAASVDFRIRTNAAPVAADGAQWAMSSGAAIGAGLFYDPMGVLLDAALSDPDGDPVRLEVEVRTVGLEFQGEATAASSWMAGIGRPSVPVGFETGGALHWQYRAMDAFGAFGPWIPFGGNGESQADLNLAPVGSRGTTACSASDLGSRSALSWALLFLIAVSRRPRIFP